jgi:hypothetical protein
MCCVVNPLLPASVASEGLPGLLAGHSTPGLERLLEQFHLKAHGAAPKTINRRISSLSSFYKYLAGAAAELRLPLKES